MPNYDKTGPLGKGEKTGRQQGKCENTKPVGKAPCARGQRCRAMRCQRLARGVLMNNSNAQ